MKELQNAYHKALEANCCSGAAPTRCWFYKDPTTTVKATVDTLVARVPVESGPNQEEEILDKDVEEEGGPEAEHDSEVRAAHSPELFSTLEEASQSQLSDVGEAQTGEEAPDRTFGTQPPPLLSPAERLRRIRKQPGRTEEDFLHEVMMHSVAEKQELKEWRDSEKRDQKKNATRQKEAMEQLLNIMEHQADTLQRHVMRIRAYFLLLALPKNRGGESPPVPVRNAPMCTGPRAQFGPVYASRQTTFTLEKPGLY
ncbi:hypothetical protein UY3_01983 [Chelonia mydas]|uniref:Uncharacterized protein n=1 Tax=Chelonia mydas TaxID=8469 RepID=M7CIQ5_CHEMY|nr:hypothetical protein UY3_01983 [Chelonia mydas]